MKKINLLLIISILMGVILAYPIINGMGCDFNYEYQGHNHEEFASCKLGRYTLLDYPDPSIGNGYTLLKGWYFTAFGNVVIWVSSHQDHTKRMTPAAIISINDINRRFWHQMSFTPLKDHRLAVYSDRPENNLRVMKYHGRLSLFN